MTNEALEPQDESRISRRNALKAAVGAGVGAVAWTGPQITSFGATPAYAVGCTFAITFDLSEDRNTDRGPCSIWRYHELRVPDEYFVGTGGDFDLTVELTDDPGYCAEGYAPDFDRFESKLFYPSSLNLDCSVRVFMYNQGGPNKGQIYLKIHPESQSNVGGFDYTFFYLPKPDDPELGTVHSSLRYSITVSCVTTGAETCFDDPVVTPE